MCSTALRTKSESSVSITWWCLTSPASVSFLPISAPLPLPISSQHSCQPLGISTLPLVTLGIYGSLFWDHSSPSPNKVFSSSIFNLNFASSVKPSVIPWIMEIPIIHSLTAPSFSPCTLIRIVT